MTGGGRRAALQSLRVYLSLILSIAILPVGFIAVQQTSNVVRDAQALQEQDFLFRTTQAARTEQALLRRAQGAASSLGAAAVELADDPATCSRIMKDFVGSSHEYVFAGFVPTDGQMDCSSGDAPMDMSQVAGWQEFIENPKVNYAASTRGVVSEQSVLIVTVPVFDRIGGELLGGASVSVPHSLTDTLLSVQIDDLHLALLNPEGDILSASTGIDATFIFDGLSLEPGEMDVHANGQTFYVTLPDDVTYLAALVPMVEGDIYALGLWNTDTVRFESVGLWSAIFPILMWVVAIGVAIFAQERLVLRHLERLRRSMNAFSVDEPRDSFALLDRPPQEVADIAETYNLMVARIMTDRAELEDNLRQKELLLREVHHRVKNNLQLIASILNMQMRTVPQGPAKDVLRRVQDRVMSIASIHKALYTGEDVTAVRADLLLEEVVRSAFRLGVSTGSDVVTEFRSDPLQLDPDQAVPLALLANECVTNAIKNVGRTQSGEASIIVTLQCNDLGNVTLHVENTLGDKLHDAGAEDGSGLGTRLIEAFVSQLGGELSQGEENEHYVVEIVFHALSLPVERHELAGTKPPTA
ncbi:sensor histidine kinase [Lutimaribacter marinistellae]|uniref:histidine kinase n=1 Tax=Lutimaribacter marinistellae TaxID=1820329 RepID=A0ABV7TNI9_9RHOB